MSELILKDIDRRILSLLQENARISNVDLADAVHLSQSPCLRRVKNLEAQGAITGYVALLDQKRVGLPVSIFVSVTLERQIEQALEIFEQEVVRHPEVMECYLMTGDADYLLRVVAADLGAYEQFLLNHLTKIPGVATIKSSFALKQVAYKTALPLKDRL